MNGILHKTFVGLKSASSRSSVSALALLGAALMQPAHADQVTTTLSSPQSVFFEGAQSTRVLSVDTTGAGMVTVNVSDLEWPVALQSLSFSGASQTQVLNTATQAANAAHDYTFSFNVGSAGAFYAQISALAGASQFGALFPSIGAYSVDVTFTQTVSSVPLPPAVWLLATGLLGFAAFSWVRRRRGLPVALTLGPTAMC